MPLSTACWLISASSSSLNVVLRAAARFSSSWRTLLAPISADVTRGSRSTQETASWARLCPRRSATAASAHRYASGQAYQNYIDPELTDWRQAYYGANYSRLSQVKARYDPGHLFRFPQAIT